MNDIASIISTVGFPIASFFISAYFIKYTYDKQIERENKNDERDANRWSELTKLTTAVNTNTEVLRDLVQHTMKDSDNNV